jgi:hypothetical protein
MNEPRCPRCNALIVLPYFPFGANAGAADPSTYRSPGCPACGWPGERPHIPQVELTGWQTITAAGTAIAHVVSGTITAAVESLKHAGGRSTGYRKLNDWDDPVLLDIFCELVDANEGKDPNIERFAGRLGMSPNGVISGMAERTWGSWGRFKAEARKFYDERQVI